MLSFLVLLKYKSQKYSLENEILTHLKMKQTLKKNIEFTYLNR